MPEAFKLRGALFLLMVCLATLPSLNALAQCAIPTRSFATTQRTYVAGAFASVDNAGDAVSGNMQSFSTLNGGLAGTVRQFLDFGAMQAAGTPVTVKLSFPSGLLSLLSGVKVQPYTNLRNSLGWTADAAGKAFSDATLLGLLNGAGDMEFTIVPQTSGGVTVPYTGVWVELSGISVAQSINVYGAFINQTGSTAVACNTPVDVLSGIRTTVIGGIATATGTVTNPWTAIDNDPTLVTYAELQVGAELLSEVFHTTIFNAQSQLGDKVRLVLQKPGGGLLDLNLLSNFTIQLYNGSVPVGSAIGAGSGLLSLSLLPGTAGNEKYEVLLSPPAAYGVFDRVDVQLGGIANVGVVPGLRIYDVKKLIANPATNIDGAPLSTITICEGNTSTLAVNNAQSCTTYKWYDSASGGTLLYTGTVYTPPAASLSTSSPNNYYVEATRDGCTESTARTPVTINVNPRPTVLPGTAVPVCTGVATTTLPYTGTNAPTAYNLTWDSVATAAGFANVVNAALPANDIHIAMPATAVAGTYNATLTVSNANGCISTATPVSVKVDARPTQPTIALSN